MNQLQIAPITEPNINPPADIKAVTSAIGKKIPPY